MTEKQKKALKEAFEILVDADLIELSHLHIGLKHPELKKNLRSDRQSQTDDDCPKQQ